MLFGKPCGKPLHDDEHCIFHSKDIEGKKNRFNAEFEKEFERQKEKEEKYDFTGFIFPNEISFKNIIFEKEVFFIDATFLAKSNFEVATFSQTTYFCDAKFTKDSFFNDVTFIKEAFLNDVTFSGAANFQSATFKGKTNFVSTKFSENKKAIFVAATFSGEANFVAAEFSGEVYFVSAEFSGEVHFNSATFSGRADFHRITFYGNANYAHTRFSKFVNFGEAQFGGEVDFTGAEFLENASFNLFRYRGKVSFREVKFYKRAEFQRTCYADEDVNNLSFEYTYFFNEKGLFDFIKSNKEKFNYSKKTKLEFLPDNFKLILGEDVAARDPTTTRKVRDDMFLLKFKDEHPCWFNIWWLFADFGRGFLRWALWSILIAVFFALLFHNFFYLVDRTTFDSKYIHETWSGLSFIYYSVVTFTTLGFGDIVPKPGLLQFLVMLEVILGYVMLGGLISILANKLARRS